MIGWILYGALCVLWGIFSVRIAIKTNGMGNPIIWLSLVFLANTVLAPISMLMAVIMCPVEISK